MKRVQSLTVVIGLLIIWSASLLSQQAPAGWPQGLPNFQIAASAVDGGGIVTPSGLCFDSSSADVGLKRSAANTLAVTNCGAATYWTLGSAGFLAGTDNSIDIGASGATRPRTGYFGTRVYAPQMGVNAEDGVSGFNLTNSTAISWSSSTTDPFGAGKAGLIGQTSIVKVTNGGAGFGSMNALNYQGVQYQMSASAGGALTDILKSSADRLTQIVDSGNVTGFELNIGTPTLGTCTSGSLESGSHNFAGRVSGINGSTCAINFGSPVFTNAPYCTLTQETSSATLRLTRTVSSMLISNVTSGTAFEFHCFGPIGT